MEEFILAIDIGGTSVKIGVVTKDQLLEKISFRNVWKGHQDKLVADLENSITRLIQKYNIHKIGVGCPGDIEDGKVLYASNLGWKNFDLSHELKKYFPFAEIKIENDGIAAVNAEIHFGKLQNVQNGLFIVFGRGVGGACIINGKIYLGENKKGGKIGHLTCKKPNGRRCNCGRIGCFETYTSVTGLIRTIKEQNQMLKAHQKFQRLSGFQIVELVKQNNPIVLHGVSIWNDDIAEEILDLAMLFAPSHIVLAGGITESGLIDLSKIKRKLNQFGYGSIDLSISQYKGNTGIIGVASLFQEKSS